MTAIQFQNKVLGIQGNMYNFAMMLTANKSDAEDLLQETTLKVLDNQEKYVENSNFKGWVLTIMRNLFINNYRKVIRSQIIIDHTNDLYHLNATQNSKLDSPEESISVQEISYFINKLSDEFKIPFLLFLDGYKYNEISEKTKLPLGTVKSRIFSARKELQNKLKDMKYYN
jgi:RNA polymerase sigma-70 factor (ECF subfamily)